MGYNATGGFDGTGKYQFRPANLKPKTLIKETTGIAAHKATEGFRDRQNNAVYDSYKRGQMAALMLTGIVGTGKQNREAVLYDSFFGKNLFEGRNTEKQKAAQNIMEKITAYQEVKFASLTDGGTTINVKQDTFTGQGIASKANPYQKTKSETVSVDLKSMSTDDLVKMVSSKKGAVGSVSYNKDGTMSVNRQTLSKNDAGYQQAVDLISIRQKMREHTLKTTSASKASSISQIRHENLNRIHSMFEDKLKDPNSKNLKEAFNSLKNHTTVDIQNTIKLLDNKLAAPGLDINEKKDLETLKAELKEHVDCLGGNERDASRRSQKALGMKTAKSLAGSDMTQGFIFYKNMGKVTKFTAKAAYRVVGGTTFHLEKGAARVADKIKLSNVKFGRKFVGTEFQTVTLGDRLHEHLDKRTESRTNAKNQKQAKKAAKSQGTLKEFNFEQRVNKMQDKYSGKAAKERLKLEKRKVKRKERNRKKGRDEAYVGRLAKMKDKLSLKKIKRNEKLGKLVPDGIKGIRNFGLKYREKWQDLREKFLKSKFGKFIGKGKGVLRFVRNPIEFAKQALMNLIKKLVGKIVGAAMTALGGLFFPVVIGGGVVIVVITAIHFISSIFRAGVNIENQMPENVCQAIVNDATEDLEVAFRELAEKDAINYYLETGSQSVFSYSEEKTPVLSVHIDGRGNKVTYDWYKLPEEAEINYIRDETGKECSTNNLMQILSMAHTRFQDEWTDDNWATMKAYVYAMYVRSHFVGGPNYPSDYCYEDLPDCSNKMLYEVNYWADKYNYLTGEIRRPLEICQNVYLHGYNKNISADRNKRRLTEEVTNVNEIIFAEHKEMGNFVSGKTAGVWIEEIPHDTSSTCDNYMAVKAGIKDLKPGDDGYLIGTYINPKAHMITYDVKNTVDDTLCGFEEHIHTADCFEIVCETAEHTHSTGEDSTCDAKACDVETAWFAWCNDCSSYDCSDNSHSKLPAVELPVDRTHGHDGNCCSIKEHTHDSIPENPGSITDAEWTSVNGCVKLTCGQPYHIHKNWVSEYNPGCWRTAYICLGHCGGHIKPQVNLTVLQKFESLAQVDNFKITKDITNHSVNKMASKIKSKDFNTIREWLAYWQKKSEKWFEEFDNTPDCRNRGRELAYAYDSGINPTFLKNNQNVDTSAVIDEEDVEALNPDNAEEKEDAKKRYEFKGWYYRDENGYFKKDKNGYFVLDKNLMDELEGFYGTYETNFEEGYENWESFGDEGCVFPAGANMPLTEKRQREILDYLKGAYPALNNGTEEAEKRCAVLKQAMDYVGKFTYGINGRIGNYKSTSGVIDCSGFVSSVLHHSLNWPNDWTAVRFAQNGAVIKGSLVPGDVVAKGLSTYDPVTKLWKPGGETNHVVIYLGYLPASVAGEDGEYIIDCSSSNNGSSMYAWTGLKNCKYVYRDYYRTTY